MHANECQMNLYSHNQQQ